MGFKKTSEGRVFFKSPDNDDAPAERPLSKALANSEPLVAKDNTQMQILLLLKSLNTKLKSSREDHEALAKDVQGFKETLSSLEKTGPITGDVIETKQILEAQKKIKALEKKAAQYEKNYIDLEQQVSGKQNEISKKAARVEENVTKTLELVETIKISAAEQTDTVLKIKEDVEKQKKIEESLAKKHKDLETVQKEQAEKMVDNTAAYVALTKRVGEAEERHDKLDNKIEEGRAEYIKLDRKIDKVIEDRNRILRKVERIEQAVIETRDALNAKAMVLLTDKGAVSGVDMPQIANQAMQTDPLAIQKRIEEEALMPWWRRPLRISTVSLVVMALLVLLVGYLISAWNSNTSQPAIERAARDPVVSLSQNDLSIPPVIDAEPVQEARIPVVNDPEPLVEPALNAEDVAAYEPAATDEKAVEVPVIPDTKPVEPAYEPDFGITIHKGVDDSSQIKKGASTIDLSNPKQVEKVFEENPEALARELNKIEPSSAARPVPLDQAVRTTQSNSTGDNTSALKTRIRPDNALTDLAKKIETQAFAGVPEAQHDLGAIYVSGHNGVQQDLDRAVLWFNEASNNGVANATYNLGVLHHRGLGMERDVPRAMKLYEKAAQQGHPEAQYNLGIANIEGVGMEYDPAKAASYFERAAKQGVMEAAYNLGLIHENGLLGQAEPGQALSWYKYAAEQGSPEAKSALNQLASSLGISVDDVNSIVDTVRKSERPSAGKNLVSQIQSELFERGFYPGPVDGEMGPITRSSIRAYQLAAELPINGEPSQTLLDVLQSSN